MSLQFIMGNSGSGKSTYLYQKIVEMATKEPRRNFYVIVPEQFTMQTQRELVERHGQKSIMNIDVVSFERLAYRVFDELGKQDVVVLEETGKNLVLRNVAESKKDELKVLRGNMKKIGYISEIKSLISELTQYNITPEHLETFLEDAKVSPSFQYKMQDIVTMYQGFEEYMRGKYVTSEEILELLRSTADKSQILKNSVLALDGFTGFTPIQNHLLRKLMEIVSEIYVTVTIDAREDIYAYHDMQELFAMSKKTISSITKMADDAHFEIINSIVLRESDKCRFKQAPMLYFLEENLFRFKYKTMEKESDEIRMYSLSDPREELRYVAGEIKRLVREEGYRYREIAVVTGDVEGYGNYVPQIFETYELPYFLDTTKNIMLHPFIEFLRSILQVMEEDFSYASVFRYLRTNLTGMKETEVDLLENYVLAAGVRGFKKWAKNFVYCPQDMTVEQLEEVNRCRQFLAQQFEVVLEVFQRKEVTVKVQTIALYEFICKLELEKQLKEKEQRYQEIKEFAKAKEYAQIYRIVMDVLDQMVSLLGEEQLTIKEYGEILDAGFDAAKVAVIPSGYDRVMVGDIERSRLEHIKVLFFIGVNDGIVPASDGRGGIISQMEREEMAMKSLELAPTARERVFIQRFYLYIMMTKPSEKLYITYARVDAGGQSLRRSYLIRTIQKIFPKLFIEEIEERSAMNHIVTPKSSLSFFIEGLQGEIRNDENGAVWSALLKWYQQDEYYQQEISNYIKAASSHYEGEPISIAVSKALYGSVLENSVTRLEHFAACACSHFLKYGLQLKEREISEFATLDMGNIYHQALENYAKKIERATVTWFDIPKEQQLAFATESMSEAVDLIGNQALRSTARNSYLLSRMTTVFKRTVWALTNQIRKGKFEPSGFEVAFAFTEELESTNFTLSSEEKMKLRGRIDRVDVYETADKLYVKIIDYKSGNTNFELLSLYHGLQLQLVVYMNAALEMMHKKHPEKEVVPAGIFYYHVNDPIVDADGHESEEEIYGKVLEKLRLNGLVNDNPEAYEAMDTSVSGNSLVIPVGWNKDGSMKKTSKAVSSEDFRTMSDYVNQKIQMVGERIIAGEVKAEPYTLGDKEGCTYCSYRAVCGFDAKIAGYQHRNLEKLDNEEIILDKMRNKNEEAD